MFRRVVSLLLLSIIFTGSFAFADENTIITVEKAIEMATEDSSNIDKIDDSIEKLWKNYRAAIEGKNKIQESLNTIEKFRELYEKKYDEKEILTLEEEIELKAYTNIFGKLPPVYSGQEMLDNFIKARDFGYYSLYAEIQKLKNTRKTINPSMEAGVRNLYNQVIGLQNTLKLQEEYLAISKEKHEATQMKYDVGQVSAYDVKISELNLNVLEKQIEQLQINLDTLEMNFNQLIDAEVTMKYVLEDTIDSVEDIYAVEPLHNELDVYLADAIQNRSEVKNARISLGVKEREDSIIKMYLTNELLTDRVNADIALIKAQNDLEVAEASVKDNVSDGYIQTLTYWNDYQFSIESLKIKQNNYEDMLKRNELGQVIDSDLALVKYQVTMAEDAVKTNLRNYLNSIDKMEKATGIGPAY
ncbi:MAG: TolC family protein [Clostridiales bacterium]|nr:TolC family protein [Clostridiales bacterium]